MGLAICFQLPVLEHRLRNKSPRDAQKQLSAANGLVPPHTPAFSGGVTRYYDTLPVEMESCLYRNHKAPRRLSLYRALLSP